MAKNAAVEGELGELHSLLTRLYKSQIVDEDGNLIKDVDPRVLGHLNKFLNDNKIYQIPEVGNEVGELDKSLKRRKKRFGHENITDIATELAKREANG